MTGRPTPERLADIRMFAADGRYPSAVDDLLAELDAMTAELDQEMERGAELTNAVLRLRHDLDAVTAERDEALQRARHSENVLNSLRGKR